MVRSPSAAWLQSRQTWSPSWPQNGPCVATPATTSFNARMRSSYAVFKQATRIAAGVTGLQPHPLRVFDISTLAHGDEGRRNTVEGRHPSFQLAQGIGPANRMFRGRTRFRAIQWRVISGARRARDQHSGHDHRDRHPTHDCTSKLGPRDVLVEAQTFGKQAQSGSSCLKARHYYAAA